MERGVEELMRRRMHGLYLSRQCDGIVELSRELLGLHCWFARNVPFSALIRGAEISGWKNALVKTWLYRGTLHGVAYDELPTLLALHPTAIGPWASWIGLPPEEMAEVAEEVIRFMEDGVYSRAELRKIYSERYDPETIHRLFSPWGGIFVHMARQGRVAFRSMVSRDFDLINAESTLTREDVLPDLLRRYFKAYGPATLADAGYFFGFDRTAIKEMKKLDLSDLDVLALDGQQYYYLDSGDMNDIPRLTLLSGFDPYIVSYTDKSFSLDPDYRKAVILSSGICLPSIAVDGKVAGLWNIKKNEPVVEFFTEQPAEIRDRAFELVMDMCYRTAGRL